MERALSAQALCLAHAAALGLAGGLLYDLLRPLRHRLTPLPTLLCDAVFCLLLGAASFALAMSAGDGRLGTVELCVGLAMFLLYQNGIRPGCLPVFSSFAKKIAKKCQSGRLFKNILQKKKNNT